MNKNKGFEKWYQENITQRFVFGSYKSDLEELWNAASAHTNNTAEPDVREITAYWEDDDAKDVLVFEQYKPDHIVVCLDVNKQFVQVMRNDNGKISSIMYEKAPHQPESVKEALEKAAKICEGLRPIMAGNYFTWQREQSDKCAKAIRALIEQADAQKDK